MNIEVQCCGIAILLLLWIFYLRQKPLGLYSVKLFLITMGMTLFCVSMDILSIVAIHHRAELPVFILAFICKTYIASLIWVGYLGLVYSCTDFARSKKERMKLNRIYTVLVIVGTVLVYVLPIQYFQEGRVVYTYGPSCMMTYFFALLFILITLYQVSVKGQEMNPKRRKAVITWMLIWMGAAIVQFLNARLLLVGFASVLGMVILFFELENPEANLDRETSAYNAHALGEYMKQLYDKQEKFASILLAFTDVNRQSDDDNDTQQGVDLLEIVRYLHKIKDVKVFKTLERELVLIFVDEERMQEVFLILKERFDQPWTHRGKGKPVYINPYYVLLRDSSMIKSAEEIFQMMHYFRMEGRTADKHITILDEKRIARLKELETTENMIVSAIEEDRIEVFYQPIYAAKKQVFTSAEALVRIREKDGGIVPPGKFIPVAEQTGLIVRIGEIVFEKTCAFIAEHDLRERYGIHYVEVNLSVKQCEKRKLADTYIEIMKKYDVDPSCINLEITESASIQTRHIFLDNIQKLLDYGVTFSLDDFGSGESNLNYIVELPVSIVKFDRGMSQAYFADYKARFVMEAAMHMIHDMELQIVSEGIETKEQMETIVALGIDYIQGYYFSRPLPGEEFLSFIEQHGKVL
ncbi:MAG: EAL domain-containing protein [Roseburia sp.]|nr:EAL domain-containing protein [Ruminococcus sp.]MCM1155887.1 EAL domain-containing protein [Roseburia sp.]MCM1243056.1 EAL domain-containing protein [Roseburia sp.]